MKKLRMAPLPEGWRRNIRANRVEGSINIGGRLRFYDTRMEFEPNLIERIVGTKSAEFRYCDIEKVSVIGSGVSAEGLFSGALRRRICVDLKNSGAEVFVVNKVERVANQIEQARVRAL